VDNETCSQVLYTGYVQPTCQPLDSVIDRLAWEYTFVPAPACKSYQVVCAALGIASVNILTPGSGYSIVTPPTVNFIGSVGSASATAVVGQGAILSTTIIEPGSGYTDGTYPNIPFLGGSGSGALGTVVVSGGAVTSISVTTAGTGYFNNDSCTLDPAFLATAGVECTFTVLSDYKTIIGITSIVNDVPFEGPVVVIISGAGGSGATAEAVMEECPVIATAGCLGASYDIPAGTLAFLESMIICKTTVPSLNVAYTVDQTGNCLCSCNLATIGVTGTPGDQVRYFYNRCGAEVVSGILTVAGSPSEITDCVVSGSVVFEILSDGATGTVSYGGSCD
jgi:hypothetical protein